MPDLHLLCLLCICRLEVGEKTELVYCMLPTVDSGDNEWMYVIEEATDGSPEAAVWECWDAIQRGDTNSAAMMLQRMSSMPVPEWYRVHLKKMLASMPQ